MKIARIALKVWFAFSILVCAVAGDWWAAIVCANAFAITFA